MEENTRKWKRLMNKDQETKGGVGERCRSREPHREVSVGATTSENAGMSSVLPARTRHTESPRFPKQGQSA